MKTKPILIGAFILLAVGMTLPSQSEEAPRMTKDQLKAMLGSPDLIVLDVNMESEWEQIDWTIKGAIREDPDKVDTWADKYPKDKTIVLFCS